MTEIGDLSEPFFSFTDTFTRLRAKHKVDDYNPSNTVEDWADPEILEVKGYLATSAGNEFPEVNRQPVTTEAQLIIDDPNADVQRGDRIAQGEHTWIVQGFPRRDKNPFTGWQPTLVISMEEVVG